MEKRQSRLSSLKGILSASRRIFHQEYPSKPFINFFLDSIIISKRYRTIQWYPLFKIRWLNLRATGDVKGKTFLPVWRINFEITLFGIPILRPSIEPSYLRYHRWRRIACLDRHALHNTWSTSFYLHRWKLFIVLTYPNGELNWNKTFLLLQE